MPASQRVILNKFQEYMDSMHAAGIENGLNWFNIIDKPKTDHGYCRGFTFLDGYMGSYQEMEAFWQELLDVVLAWDGDSDTLEEQVSMQHAIKDEFKIITRGKAIFTAMHYVFSAQQYLHELLGINKKNTGLRIVYGPETEVENRFGFYESLVHSKSLPIQFNLELFKKFLTFGPIRETFASSSKIYLLKGKNHVTRLSYEKQHNRWRFFDSNDTKGLPRYYPLMDLEALYQDIGLRVGHGLRIEEVTFPVIVHHNDQHSSQDGSRGSTIDLDEAFIEADDDLIENEHPFKAWMAALSGDDVVQAIRYEAAEYHKCKATFKLLPMVWKEMILSKVADAYQHQSHEVKAAIGAFCADLLNDLKHLRTKNSSRVLCALMQCASHIKIETHLKLIRHQDAVSLYRRLLSKDLNRPLAFSEEDLNKVFPTKEGSPSFAEHCMNRWFASNPAFPRNGCYPVTLGELMMMAGAIKSIKMMLPEMSTSHRQAIQALVKALHLQNGDFLMEKEVPVTNRQKKLYTPKSLGEHGFFLSVENTPAKTTHAVDDDISLQGKALASMRPQRKK